MRGWICRRYTDPFEIELAELDERDPGPNEVKIRMRAGGISWEALILRGKYQVQPPLPYTVGGEIAGDIIATGSAVKRFKPGDPVIAVVNELSNESGGGCFVDRPTINQRFVVPLPSGFSYEEGAALRSSYETSFHGLVRRGNLTERDVLLVHGAAGGVGSAAIQIARHYGATTIAVASTTNKRAAAIEDGASYAFAPDAAELRTAIRDITKGRGVDIVYDPVSGDLFDAATSVIAPGGRLLVVGFTSGRFASIATNRILVKMISVIGVELRRFTLLYPDIAARDRDTVLALASQSHIRPRISKVFRMEDLPDAFAHIDSRQAIGKAVIVNA